MKPAFRRKVGTRHYKRNLIIVTEGEATEQSYLRIVSRLYILGESFNFIFAHKGSGILDMLTAMAAVSAATEDFKPERRDAKWIVLDRDAESHLANQLADLQAWEEAEECCHVAMTTPRFDYRILFHKPDSPRARKLCMHDNEVEKLIPRFKNLPIGSTAITKENVEKAMERAAHEPQPTCTQPDIPGSSFVHLMEQLLRTS